MSKEINKLNNKRFIFNKNELIKFLKNELKQIIINYSINFSNNKILNIIKILKKIHILDLPNICQSNIFSYLSYTQILSLKIISKQFNNISKLSTSISNAKISQINNSLNLNLFKFINNIYKFLFI